MNHWARILRAMSAARMAWGNESLSVAPPHSLEGRRTPEPTVPAAFIRPARAQGRIWHPTDKNTWYIYQAVDHRVQRDKDRHLGAFVTAEDMAYDKSSAYARIRQRSTGRLEFLGPGQVGVAQPLALRLFWLWHLAQTNGMFTDNRGQHHDLKPFHIFCGEVFWVGEEPVVMFHRVDGMPFPSGGGDLHTYVTRIVLPQPPLALQQTFHITPELSSSMKALNMTGEGS